MCKAQMLYSLFYQAILPAFQGYWILDPPPFFVPVFASVNFSGPSEKLVFPASGKSSPVTGIP